MPRLLAALACLVYSSLAFAQLPPDKALASLTVADGLQVELFAAEPMLINPTSMDIDHKGRVWIAEAVNYRRKPPYNRPMLRHEGDRIQVLIDKDGDSKADEATTFYQAPEIYGPLGVCVAPYPDGKGQKVFVCQSPDILVFEDKDGDLKADGPPAKFLTGFQGFDHDHGVHGLNIGPDGKLYFTVGDSGVKDLQSSDGKGKKWTSNTADVQKGTVWRCDFDGKNLELIAHNFRNNYECCVNSFGEVWLSDNDDDGNQQTRICFVMPGGNYGYGPRGPGQSHWHEEQPGIVHKTLRTGFGSPTGICFYEGTLLPKRFHGSLLHTDAGPRELRAFHIKAKGAGHELTKENILTSTDNWFRLSDVCVAPDGSVFVCDWYDPGVGGHGMGDWTRGRVYRVTPKGHTGYKVPEVKLDTTDGILETLSSPCLATRALAQGQFRTAAQENKRLDPPSKRPSAFAPELRARTIALAAGLEDPKHGIAREIDPFGKEPESLRTMTLRVTDTYGYRMPQEVWGELYQKMQENGQRIPMAPGFSPAVARELLLLLRKFENIDATKSVFYALAKQYDGQDIFYRAALNIACGTDPARRDAILADFDTHFPEWNDKVADLVWELRPKSVLPRMEKLLGDPKLTAAQKARIVDILAVNDSIEAGKSMLKLLAGDAPTEVKMRAVENLKLFLPTKWAELKKGDEVRATISQQLRGKAPIIGLWLAAAAPDCTQFDEVEAVVRNAELHPEVRREAVVTCGKIRNTKLTAFLATLTTDPDLGPVAVTALGAHVGGQGTDAVSKAALDALQGLVLGKDQPAAVKESALAALAGSRTGTQWLLALKERGGFPESLAAGAGRLLRNSPHQDLRNRALIAFPAPGKLDMTKLAPIAELAKRKGDAANGQAILAKSITSEVQCLKCHMVRGQGGQIGPDLSMIGKKGSRENLFESLLQPAKAIADQYVNWKIDTADGQSLNGLIVGETAQAVTLRDANGKDYTLALKDIEKRAKLTTSLMPDNLVQTLTEDELIDVVEYMVTLQTPSLTPESWHLVGPFRGAGGNLALDIDYGPEAKAFDAKAAFPETPIAYGQKPKDIGWRVVRPGASGYVDLAALHGQAANNSVSFAYKELASLEEQEATILLGTDDGAKLWVNGKEVFSEKLTRAAAPEQNRVTVKLKKGKNELLLKVANGNNPHGFYLTILSVQELKAK